MKRIIIAAISQNRGIGIENDLPWSLPEDMKFFKRQTSGKTVIMGRKNYESIPHKYRPLPNRENIIVTSQANYQADGCIVVNSVEDAIKQASVKDEIYIIGGGQIYTYALSNELVDEMYLTEVHADIDADVFFPEFDTEEWEVSEIMQQQVDSNHPYSFTVKHFTKK